MRAKTNKNNLQGHELAELLNIWSNTDESELYAGDGRKIEGDEKKEIMGIVRKMILTSPINYTCSIIDIERYRKIKRERTYEQ